MSHVQETDLVEGQTYWADGVPMLLLGRRSDPCWGLINVWARPGAEGWWRPYENRAGNVWLESGPPEEVAAVCRLLHIAPTPENGSQLGDLGPRASVWGAVGIGRIVIDPSPLRWP